MSIQNVPSPHELERYSFLWSEVRLVIAAVSLLGGGYPVVWFIFPLPFVASLVAVALRLSWIISGVASGYLLYRWNETGQKLFGKKDSLDTTAFFVSVVSGINLGLTGLFGTNIGMTIFWGNSFFYAIAAVAYLGAAYHLYTRWLVSGRKIFHS